MFVVKNTSVTRFLERAAIADRIESKISPLLIGSNETVIQDWIAVVPFCKDSSRSKTVE